MTVFWIQKITKRAFEGYVSPYHVEIFNFFNSGLTLKDTKSAIKNKIIDLLTELKSFKLVITLVLEFKKIKNDDKTNKIYHHLFKLKSRNY